MTINHPARSISILLTIFSFNLSAQEYQTDANTVLLLHGNGADGAISHPISNPENYDSYTKLMLHMDGSDGSTAFTDAATSKIVTVNGDAQIDIAQSKFGGASGLFDGNGDYLSVPDNDDWYFGTSDFTIDFWVKFNNLPTSPNFLRFVGQYEDANNWWHCAVSYAGYLYFYYRNTSGIRADYYANPPQLITSTWYHIAWVRNGANFYIFINGLLGTMYEQTPISNNELTDIAQPLDICANGPIYLDGWIDELRVTKGIARWVSNFTPPTFPYGKVALTTSQSKFGGASMMFDGSGSYLSTSDRNDWVFGSGNFTIDFWVRFPVSSPISMGLYSQYVDNSNYVQIYIDGAGQIDFRDAAGNGYFYTTGIPTIDANTWYHLALVRNGANPYIFINGVPQAVTINTPFGNLQNLSASVEIGKGQFPGNIPYMNGWLDEFRITKGTARWTSNFTPPTSPYTTDSATTLLLHFDGIDGDTTTNDAVGGDESGKNKIVTYSGNAQLDNAQSKFSESSMLFDGNGDYLSLPDNDDWYFGGGDFTIDSWIRFAGGLDGIQYIASQYSDGNHFWSFNYDVNRLYFRFINGPGSNIVDFFRTWTPSLNIWYHVAVVRTGNVYKLFVNGDQLGSDENDPDTHINLNGNLHIGMWDDHQFPFNGWIDEFRISKGVAREFGAISGVKFEDLDGDGVKDTGEPGLSNWKIYLTGTKTDSTLTDTSGAYRFSYLMSGTYSVYEKQQFGWIKTKPSPDSGYTIILPSNADTTGFNFGNYRPGMISGQKYNDLDANGTKNGDDSGLVDWLIRLKKNDIQIDSTLTDADGNYSFTDLGPDNYTLSEKPQANWDQTYPLSPGTYNFQLLSGDTLTDKDFANHWAVDNSLTLRCFRDKDGNFNTRDDLVSKRWNLRLYSDLISPGTLVKDTSAPSFTMLNITPGTYIAVEADSNGWDHIGKLRDTAVYGGTYNKDTITISADESHVITFVNFHPNSVIIRKFRDNDGDFGTTGDRSGKKWLLSLYKGLIQPQNLVASIASAESLKRTDIGEGTYTAIEGDSTGWTHIGTILNGTGTASNLNLVQFTTSEGQTQTIDFINARLGSITVSNWLDQDGDFRTKDGGLTPWAMKLYRINGVDTSMIDSVNNSSSFTRSNLPSALYKAAEADSGHPWSHIATEIYKGGSLQRVVPGAHNSDTLTLSENESWEIRFVNFNQNRIKYWTAVEDCDWSNGYNWEPPGVPIPGDSIVVPDTARCALYIPEGSSVGTIVVAAQESVYTSSGSFESTGDVSVEGTLIADGADSSTITVGGDWSVNRFDAGQSTVLFTGTAQQTIEGNDNTFYRLKISDGATNDILTDGSFSVQENLYLGGNINAAGDTVKILNPSPGSVAGSGRVLKGTLRRSVEQGVTSSYRFESPQSYIQFDGTGTYPDEISMTVMPDTVPSDDGDVWEEVPSTADTLANVITADTVDKFSKWRMGIPRVQGIDPQVRRRYTLHADGGEGFSAKVVLRYEQSEVPAGLGEDSLKLLRSVHANVSMAWYLSAGWNIISLPVEMEETRVAILFPTAISSAYYYEGGYQEEDTLKKGISYWIKFGEGDTIEYEGGLLISERMTVREGWNMVGSISDTVPAASIESDPPGIVTSEFFEYAGGYRTANTIYPGRGYWVKVSQAGELIMSSSGMRKRSGLIRIERISELPPEPPGGNGELPEELPKEYGLEQAYPNPFNPATVIRYRLPVASRVTLTVYNVLGEVVDVLKDGIEDAGYKSISWNAGSLSSGVYFYKLETVNITETNKSFVNVKKVIFMR